MEFQVLRGRGEGSCRILQPRWGLTRWGLVLFGFPSIAWRGE